MQTEWASYIHQPTEQHIARESHQIFTDSQVQGLLTSLIQQGMIAPETVEQDVQIPGWAKSGVQESANPEEKRQEKIASLLTELLGEVSGFSLPSRWDDWQRVAMRWAELNAHWYSTEITNPDSKQQFKALADILDRGFLGWLEAHYSALGAQRLPVPKQVHHVPHFIEYQRERNVIRRAAMVVLDGLSLADWLIIRSVWAKRNPGWKYSENLLLAQVPTITSISRRSLISGLPPAGFASDLDHLPAEKALWAGFWSRTGLPPESFYYSTISLDRQEYPIEIDSGRMVAVCLVEDTPDKLVHSAYLGAVDHQMSLRLWLSPEQEKNSLALESLLDHLLDLDYAVYLTSDHGHVEAHGISSPSQGILAQTRGKRARLYKDDAVARRAHEQFPATVMWQNDGVLPPGVVALMPIARDAFTTDGETVVSHGGLSIDEMVVPFVKISR